MEPQHDSVTNCGESVLVLLVALYGNRSSHVLHGACERIVTLLEGGIDVVLARHSVTHFDALVEEDFVGFFDFFFGVVGDHFCDVDISRAIGWLQSGLVVFYLRGVIKRQ
jgi:hypothetical protein